MVTIAIQLTQNGRNEQTQVEELANGAIKVTSTFIALSARPKICIAPNELSKQFTYTEANLNRGTKALDYVKPQSSYTVIKELFDNLNQVKLDFKSGDEQLKSLIDLNAEQFRASLKSSGELTREQIDQLSEKLSSTNTNLDTLNQELNSTIVQTAERLTKDYNSKITTGDSATLTSARNFTTETAEEIKRTLTQQINTGDNSITKKLNEVKSTVDGNTTTIASLKTDLSGVSKEFQQVKETSNLYERVLGNTEDGIPSNIARIVSTSGLIEQEVAKVEVGDFNLIYNYFSDMLYSPGDTKGKNGNFALLEPRTTYTFTWKDSPYRRQANEAPNTASYAIYFDVLGKIEGSFKVAEAKTETDFDVKQVTFTTPWPFAVLLDEVRVVPNSDKDRDFTIGWYKLTQGNKASLQWTPSTYNLEMTRTKVTQTANSWAVKTLNSRDDVLAEINQTDGLTKIKNKLIKLDGDVSMTNAFAKKLLVDNLQANDVKAFTMKFANAIGNNLDINSLSGNLAKLGQAIFDGRNSRVRIDPTGMQIMRTDGNYSTKFNDNGIEIWRSGTHVGSVHSLDAIDTSGPYVGMKSMSLTTQPDSYLSLSYYSWGSKTFNRALSLGGDGRLRLHAPFYYESTNSGFRLSEGSIDNIDTSSWRDTASGGGIMVSRDKDVWLSLSNGYWISITDIRNRLIALEDRVKSLSNSSSGWSGGGYTPPVTPTPTTPPSYRTDISIGDSVKIKSGVTYYYDQDDRAVRIPTYSNSGKPIKNGTFTVRAIKNGYRGYYKLALEGWDIAWAGKDDVYKV